MNTDTNESKKCFICVYLCSSQLFFRKMDMPTSDHTPLIIAHRGASGEAPENTLASFELGWQVGADGIEGDFHLTRDGRIVCMHDHMLSRTAGVDVKIAEATLAELRAYDVGRWKGPQFAGQRIPTFEEFLATVPKGRPEKRVYIELKCGPEILPPLERILSASGVSAEQVRIISFGADVLAACKDRLPQLRTCWLAGYRRDEATGRHTPDLDEVLATLHRIKADGLDTHGNRDVVDEPFVDGLRAAGMEVHVWTIDSPDDARYFSGLGVDSITSNRPRELLAALR
jgi:glycerophosphoryl diester phosphodiesterase